ncbi:MAG: hypothetical protein RLZZ200_2826 [Pseudomonadota bacterium]|jgi:hypothetical protein
MSRRRSTFDVFSASRGPCVIGVQDMAGRRLQTSPVAHGESLRAALEAGIARWVADGWTAENTPEWGHVFIRRGAVRLMVGLFSATPSPGHSTPAPRTPETKKAEPSATILPFRG